MSIEAMKQALGALETAEAEGNCEYGATSLLRTAIAEAEKHEPVAWITKWSRNGSRGTVLGYKKERHHGDVEHIPLYTTPPAAQQEPVAWMWSDGTTTSDPDRADGTWTPLYTAPQRVCSGCDKVNTNDSMWAVYCVDCWEKTEALEEVKMELKQEPFAYSYMGIKQDGSTNGPYLVWKPEYMDAMSASKGAIAIPLYTAPRQWVGLTDDEVYDLADEHLYNGGKNYGILSFYKAIEAKLKEKNCA